MSRTPLDIRPSPTPPGPGPGPVHEAASAPTNASDPVPSGPSAWVGRLHPLLLTAYSLSLNTAVTAGLGFAFWLAAARVYTPSDLGRGSAAVALAFFLAGVTQLQLPTSMQRLLPEAGPGARRLAVRASLVAGGLGVAVTAAVVFVDRLLGGAGTLGDGELLGAVLLVLAVPGLSLFTIVDGVLVGLGRAVWILPENAAFGLAKLVLVIAFARLVPTHGVLLSWVAILPLSIAGMWVVLTRTVLPRVPGRRGAAEAGPQRQGAVRMVTGVWVAGLFGLAVLYLPPVLVATRLGAGDAAYFGVAWTMGLMFAVAAEGFATGLTVAGSRQPDALDELVRRSLRQALVLFGTAGAFGIVVAPWALRLFGAGYEERSTLLLRLTFAAAVCRIPVSLTLAVTRVERRFRSMITIEAVTALAVVVVGGAMVRHAGFVVFGWLHLATQVVLAAVLTPRLLMRTRLGRQGAAGQSSQEEESVGQLVEASASQSIDDAVIDLRTEPGRMVPIHATDEVPDTGTSTGPSASSTSPAAALDGGGPPLAVPRALAGAVLASGAFALAADIGGWRLSPLRAVAALAFVLLGPGLGIVARLPLRHRGSQLALAASLSMAVGVTVDLGAIALGIWNARAIAAILLVGSAIALLPVLRTRSPDAALPRVPEPAGVVPETVAVVASGVVTAVALTAWRFGLDHVVVARTGAGGLVGVLPTAWFVAFAVLVGTFVAAAQYRRPRAIAVLLPLVGALVMLHATTSVLYEVPRYAWTYKHVGVVLRILANGSVTPSTDVYNSWPGLFAFASLVARLGGFLPSLSWAAWAQLVSNLLYLPALLFALRGLGVRDRVAWTGTGIFFLTNWIGQDYFSPQSFAFFLHLVVVAVCLHLLAPAGADVHRWSPPAGASPRAWLRSLRQPRVGSGPGAASGQRSWRRAPELGEVLVLALVTVIAVSHPLTPFLTLMAMAALVATGRIRSLRLVVACAAVTALWIALVARPGVEQFGGDIAGSLGQVLDNIRRNVPANAPSPARSRVLAVQRLLVASMFALGVLSCIRQLRTRRSLAVSAACLAFTPPLLIAVQAYGGEMLLRTYLFSLPWLAFLVADLLVGWSPETHGTANVRRSVRHVAVGAFVLLLGAGQVVASFGNEATSRVDPEEFRVAQDFYAQAPSGSLLVNISARWPGRASANYDRFLYEDAVTLEPAILSAAERAAPPVATSELDALVDHWRSYGVPVYVMYSAGQMLDIETRTPLGAGSAEVIDGYLREHPDLELVADRSSARLYRLRA